MEKEARSAGIVALVNKSDSDATEQLLAHGKVLFGPGRADFQCAS